MPKTTCSRCERLERQNRQLQQRLRRALGVANYQAYKLGLAYEKEAQNFQASSGVKRGEWTHSHGAGQGLAAGINSVAIVIAALKGG